MGKYLRNLRMVAFSVALVVAVLWLMFRPQSEVGERFSGMTMGTTYAVRLRSCEPADCGELQAAVQARLAQLEARFSHYDPESPVARFNRADTTDWFPMDAELLSVIDYALSISWQSEGAFDITAAPLVDAWGFGPEQRTGVPDARELARLREHVGFRKLSIRESPPALAKSDPELRIDLSAIAKGYAVDQVALLLEGRGINDYLIDIGGEVRTSGVRRRGSPWRVGIEPPDAGLSIRHIITPLSEAVASSGDYRNYFEADGKRYSHALDPRTGRPVTHDLAAVTVIQPSTIQADALATMLLVMGPETAISYAEERDIPALFWLRTEQGPAAVNTRAFNRYLLRD